MNIDWKDALSALRENLDNPGNEEQVSDSSEVDQTSNTQKEPLTVITDKKGRNGKIATIIEGFTVDQNIVEDIAAQLKKKIGVGGSVRTGEILIQGDHKDKVVKFLRAHNFKTKV